MFWPPQKTLGYLAKSFLLSNDHNIMYMAVDLEENARLAFDELPIGEDLPEVLAYIETVESS
ncbi:hypothetical protein DVH24_042201 [Malus domestica]|uniref:Uncharacterized protein n=1 Tax=Malus domestica TaxID=3750 RepID=A0A498IY41_MALDO|nr:hypothetical protein DVH24_042201 [Malus domestica]